MKGKIFFSAISPKGKAIIFSFMIVLFFIWLLIRPPAVINLLLKRLDYIAYDLRLNLLISKIKTNIKNPIVIVDIDEKSLREEGRWPWPRDKLANLLEKLYQQEVTVIAFDMLFSEAEKDKDEIFATALSHVKNKVILSLFFSPNKDLSVGFLPKPILDLEKNKNTTLPINYSYISNLPILQNAAGSAGAISTIPDYDGDIRRYSLLQRYKNTVYPSLALEAVRLYLLENKISLDTVQTGQEKFVDAIKLGNMKISTDSQGRVFIPYQGPSRTFPYYSASDILHDRLPPHQLQNTLVFIGTSAIGLSDIRSTPVDSVFPGVEVHANVAEGLLSHHFPYVPSWIFGAQFFLLLFLGISLAVIFSFLGSWLITLVSFIFLSVIFLGSLLLWQFADIVFPIILPIFLVMALAVFKMAYGFSVESKRRDELKKVFEQYVPSGHVAKIIQNLKGENVFEGERKMLSVLFMDIRNFTAISEKLSITDLKKLLNFFLTEMTGVIFAHGGTVDKYVGDMVMAFWGAPLNDPDHAVHALSAGLHMLTVTQNLQSKLADMQLPAIKVGVGINTGIMDVGDMGSTYRRAYTVLGDVVNLASRLESLTKYYGVEIICGENARNQANQAQDKDQDKDFVFRLLDKVRVKGKQIGQAIYQPIGLKKLIDPAKLTEIDQHHQALNAYFEKDFTASHAIFSALNAQFPETLLYQIYLARIKTFIASPPLAEWDGVFEHTEK